MAATIVAAMLFLQKSVWQLPDLYCPLAKSIKIQIFLTDSLRPIDSCGILFHKKAEGRFSLNWFFELIRNPFLITSISSWFIAQVLKVIIHAIVCKSWDLERLFGDGGMPSGHSATVSSLATICGLSFGLASVEFAITAILAIIVCHDATGVRRETGRHAEILNELLKSLETRKPVDLKELVGHTPLQVVAGVLIGVGNALLMYFVIL